MGLRIVAASILFNENQRTSKSQQIQYDSCCFSSATAAMDNFCCVAHLLILIRNMHEMQRQNKKEKREKYAQENKLK